MNKTLNRLNQMIENVRTSGRPQDVTDLMNNMLFLMSQNCNLSSLAGNVIKLLPTPNVPLKKVICAFLIRYSESISDLNILTSNSLRKDFLDPNPQVRKLVIKTVCVVPCLKDLSLELLPKALKDQSIHVRQTAAAFCPKVIDVQDNGSSEIIEQLYTMIRDEDPLVVSNSLTSLNEILKHEGGVVINYKMARYLFNRIISFPEWAMSNVCKILINYKVKNEEEALEFLNIIDSKLCDQATIVIISILDLAFSLIQKFNQNLQTDIVNTVEDSLFTILKNCSPEMFYMILEHIDFLIPNHKDIFFKYYKLFFCHFKDPICLKVKKLRILPLLLQCSNYNDIVENVTVYLTSCETVSKQAISTFIKILQFNEVTPEQHIQILFQLLTTDNKDLYEQIIISLSTFNLEKFGSLKESLFTAVSERYFKICSDEGTNALLTIISNYGNCIENSPYILEKMASDNENIFNNEMLYNYLLITSLKLFLSRPAEMQLIIGKILQDAMQSKFVIVKAQAIFYNTLLQTDLPTITNIINGQLISAIK